MQISLFIRMKNNSVEGCVAVWQGWIFMVCMRMTSFSPHFSPWSLWKLLPPPHSLCWPASRLRQYSSKCLSSTRSTKNSTMGSFPECSSGVTSSVLGTSSKSWWVTAISKGAATPHPSHRSCRFPFSDCGGQRDQSLWLEQMRGFSPPHFATAVEALQQKLALSLSLIKDCSKPWW